MAKKDKVPLTPEQIAEKKLNKKKNWARCGAIVLALVITAGVYFAGSKGGHRIERVEPQAVVVDNVVEKVVTQEVTVTVTVPAPTEAPTEAPTQAPTETPTEAPTEATTAPSNSDDGGILDTLTGLLGGLTDGLGGIGDSIGGLLGGGGGIDLSGAADTIEGIGSSAQDFFYNIADRAGTTTEAE